MENQAFCAAFAEEIGEILKEAKKRPEKGEDRFRSAKILALIGGAAGAGPGALAHTQAYRKAKKFWLEGRRDIALGRPPLIPEAGWTATSLWDYINKPKYFTPSLARRVLTGMGAGAMTGGGIGLIHDILRRKRKRRK